MTKITDARLASFDAVLSCPHEIDHDRVILKVDHSKEGNALAQLHARLSSLEASPAPVSEHPDNLAVDRFAAAMKAKLAKKREEGRGGWESKDECSAEFLSKLLREHVEKGDPLDVGNLAMMLHQRGDAIAPAPVSEPTDEMVDVAHEVIEQSFLTECWEFGPPSSLARAALRAALAAKGGQ